MSTCKTNLIINFIFAEALFGGGGRGGGCPPEFWSSEKTVERKINSLLCSDSGQALSELH